MTNIMQETRDWTSSGPDAPATWVHGTQQIASLARANAEAGIWWMSAATKIGLAWQQQAVDLAGLQMERAREARQRIVEAGDSGEVLRAQADYLRTLVQDHLQSSRRLLEGIARISEEVWGPLQQKIGDTAGATERAVSEVYSSRGAAATS